MKDERPPTPVRCFAVRLHRIGLSVREAEDVLKLLGVGRCYQAVWNRREKLAAEQNDPLTAAPSRVDEKQITVDDEEKWLYAAIDTYSKLLLEFDFYNRRGTDPAAVFLHRLTEQHDVENAKFLVDPGGYLTTPACHELSGHLDCSTWNHIEKWFQTMAMQIDRFHSFWRGSPTSVRQWLRRSDTTTTTNDRIRP